MPRFKAVTAVLLAGLATAALALLLAGVASSAPTPARIRGSASASAVPGRYIVVLKDTPSLRTRGVPARARALADAHAGTVDRVYQTALHGFATRMSKAQALRLAAEPDVAYVEQDQRLYPADTQENPPAWGLDRIDQRTRPLDHAYSYDTEAGAGVTAYVIDTGIRISHTDFGGRASYGWNFADNNSIASDCLTSPDPTIVGHGTHVAGILGGTRYGVAKRVHLVSLKVFDCHDGAFVSTFIAAVDWVTAHAVKPAVVNMSVGQTCLPTNPCSADDISAVDTAVTNSIRSGLPYVVAAGNDSVDACTGLMSRVALAITVAATDINDVPATYSDWGRCVNIWAPGGGDPNDPFPTPGIPGPDITSDTAVTSASGTSEAAPHVAGAVALILSRPGWATKTPAEISDELLNHMATNGAVTDLPGHNSTTRLLYTAPPPPAGGSSIAAARNLDGRLALFGVNRAGNMFVRTETGANVDTWSPWLQSVQSGWYSVAAQANGADRIELMGLRRSPEDVWHRTQTAANSATFHAWAQMSGLLTSVTAARSTANRLELFGTNQQGQAWHTSENGVDSDTFPAWQQFDLVGAVLRSIVAETNSQGLVEVFALTNTGQIWHRWQTSATATTYTPWVQLDGALASIAVARNQNGTLELFGVNAAGQVFHRDAATGTNNWFSWSQLDDPPAVGRLSSLAAETNADGRVEVFAVNAAGQIWRRWQTAPGAGTYSPWVQLDGLLRP